MALGTFTTELLQQKNFHNGRFFPLSRDQKQKIPSYSSSPYQKTPGYKKSAGKILKFDFFNSLDLPLQYFYCEGDQGVKKIKF